MDELIGRLVADGGIDRNAAETSIGIILDFRAIEGPADKMKIGGVVGADRRTMGAGLSMGQVQGVNRQFTAYARGKIGEDVFGEIVGAIPGFSQLV
jgi:hypothetical protein